MSILKSSNPGVSGGGLAAILGIYERMLHFLAHICLFLI
jgi:uncharacterized membrane protein